MNFKRKITGLILVLWLLPCAPGWAAPQDKFVLVVNTNNSIISITRKDVELIFLSKKRFWPDGRSITVVINENPETYTSFSQTILKRSTRQYVIFQKKMLFRGQGMPPYTVKTDQDVINFVATHSASFGYVSPEAFTSLVKILPISP